MARIKKQILHKHISITSRLNPHRSDTVENNVKYLNILLEYIRYFCVQEIPFRGDEETSNSLNRGNFSELLEVNFSELMKGNFKVNKYFRDASEKIKGQYSMHVDYLSKTIYSELISLMASEVRRRIGDEVRSSLFYSLLMDESKDNCGHEQLSFSIRFCCGSVHNERFLGYSHIREFDALSLSNEAEVIISMLYTSGTHMAISIDGARVMSGHISGVQARHKNSSHIYIHCNAHRLNLIIISHFQKYFVKIVLVL